MKLSQAVDLYIQRKRDAGMRFDSPRTYCARFFDTVATSIFTTSPSSKSPHSSTARA